MPIVIFNNFTQKDKEQAVDRLIKGGTPSQDFFLMVVLSILTATFGLLLNNSAVIIGSMLIAPILYPVLSLSLGITMADINLVSRSFWTLLKSVVLGIAGANIASLIFINQLGDITPEILLRSEPALTSVVIAIIVGFAASFALVKEQLSETLPGIAISVALIPPIAVTGIGISHLDWPLITGSLLLFVVNTIGVIGASMVTFSLMRFHTEKTKARKTIQKEEIKIKKEENKAKKEHKK